MKLTQAFFIGFVVIFNLQGYSQSNEVKMQSNDSIKAVQLLKIAGEIYEFYPDSAQKYAEEALELSQKLNEKKGIANAILKQGIIEEHRKNYVAALSFYKQGLQIAEENQLFQQTIFFYSNILNLYFY